MQISRGQRIPLAQFIQGSRLGLSIEISCAHTIDYACFGVDADGRLSDDRYMVFFNQPQSPCGGVVLTGKREFRVDLDALPSSIARLVFTACIDGDGVMRDIGASRFSIHDSNGGEQASCSFDANLFQSEKAIMVAELYRRDGAWRLNANLQGFNEGLAALVRHFGGEVAEDTRPAPAPAPSSTISLEKKIAQAAPHLVNLAKKAQVSLEKKQLTSVKARVALVLDASGSMNGQYSKGRVQEVVNRLMPLAVHFDDDGAIDCWAFARHGVKLSPISLANHQHFIDTDSGGWRRWKVGPRINNEPEVMEQVIAHYEGSSDRTPVYVMFISDGGVGEDRKISKLMVRAAELPIFWQFVGIGGRNYGILEKLDDMSGRIVDNCNFFALDDLHDISEEQLYDRLMEEFPGWLKAARTKGILG